MQYMTRLDDDATQAHVNYACPCGCIAGVLYSREGGTADLGQCCCGRLLWVGEGAEAHVREAFKDGAIYEIEKDDIALPWGQSVQAVLAVPANAEHGVNPAGAPADTVHDPVCHMDIDPKTAAATSEYDGVTYYFCARGCKLDFDDDPAGVLAAEAAYDHSRPVDHGMGAAAVAVATKPWWQFWKN
jgi:YHS domain-containing protein